MKIRNQLDDIYNLTRQACEDEKFDLVNKMLIDVNIDNEPIEVLIGWLTACLSVYSKLPYLDEFYDKVEKKIEQIVEPERAKIILKGLEPKDRRWKQYYYNGNYYGD